LSNHKIIKAGYARLLPMEIRPHKFKNADAADDAVEFEVEIEEPALTAEEIQAAYDEAMAAAQRETELMLRSARDEARRLVSEANAEAEHIRQAAYAKGLENGHTKGYEDFIANGESVLLELVENGQGEVDKTISDAYAERDRLLDEMEPRILRLALDIGEKILGYELDENKNSFVSLVTTALNSIRSEGRVTLRVSPEQYKKSFNSKAEALFRTELGAVEAEVVADIGLESGGCLIEAGKGTVDASVDAQLEQISGNLGF
jgi:flagellar assembly protein FliH